MELKPHIQEVDLAGRMAYLRIKYYRFYKIKVVHFHIS